MSWEGAPHLPGQRVGRVGHARTVTVCALQTEAMTSSSESVYFQIKGITFAYIPQQNLKFDFYNLILEKSQQFALEDDLRFPLLFWVKQPQTVTLGGDVNVNACVCTHKCVHPL